MENLTSNPAVETATDPAMIALVDYLFESMGKPATANDILKARPEIGNRKTLFALLEKLTHKNLIQSDKAGTKDGHDLVSFTWWINDDHLAFELWRTYLRDAV